MGKAVLHFQKQGKVSGGSLGHHIDRVPGMEYSYRHADPLMIHRNIHVKVNSLCELEYNEAIRRRISEGYNARNKAGELKAIRKDAVHSCNVMLSGSPEDLNGLLEDNEKLRKWVSKNLEFCTREFGKENIVRFSVHLDEKTPHIHCVFVPITKDGRLSVGDWIGTGKKLEEYQTKYAEEMESFGLERGERSNKKHVTTKDWRRMERYKEVRSQHILEDLKNLKQTDLLSFQSKKATLQAKLEAFTRNEIIRAENRNNALKSRVMDLERTVSHYDRRRLELPRSKFLSQEQIREICESVSIKDYFFYLMEKGKVDFEKKSAGEYYFRTESGKFSVSDKGYYDFKNGQGGQIIKAVMEMEGLGWKDSLDFLQKFSGLNFGQLSKKVFQEESDMPENTFQVTALFRPNNPSLLAYYYNRGIDPQLLRDHVKQVHYQVRSAGKDSHYFGIGMKNLSGGWEIRSTESKIKLGTSDITQLGNPESREIMVFEGMTDMLSFLQIQRDNEKNEQRYRLICLNSTANTQKLIDRLQHFSGEISLCLDADKAGDFATLQLQEQLKAKDIREFFGIHQGKAGSKDLNQVLMKAKGLENDPKIGRNFRR